MLAASEALVEGHHAQAAERRDLRGQLIFGRRCRAADQDRDHAQRLRCGPASASEAARRRSACATSWRTQSTPRRRACSSSDQRGPMTTRTTSAARSASSIDGGEIVAVLDLVDVAEDFRDVGPVAQRLLQHRDGHAVVVAAITDEDLLRAARVGPGSRRGAHSIRTGSSARSGTRMLFSAVIRALTLRKTKDPCQAPFAVASTACMTPKEAPRSRQQSRCLIRIGAPARHKEEIAP